MRCEFIFNGYGLAIMNFLNYK